MGSSIYYGLESMPPLQVELVYPEGCWVLRFPLQNQLVSPLSWDTGCCLLASLCLAWGSPMVQNYSHSMGQAHSRARETAIQRPDCFPWLETSVRPAQPQPHPILHSEGSSRGWPQFCNLPCPVLSSLPICYCPWHCTLYIVTMPNLHRCKGILFTFKYHSILCLIV